MDRRDFLALIGAAATAPMLPAPRGYTPLADRKHRECMAVVGRLLCFANDRQWLGAEAGTLRLDYARMTSIEDSFSGEDRPAWLFTFTYNPRGFDWSGLVNGRLETLARWPRADMHDLLRYELCEIQLDPALWVTDEVGHWLGFRERRARHTWKLRD